MIHDNPFRIALLAFLLVLLPIAGYFRIRSNATRERLDRWQEGALILFGLRLSSVPGFVAAIAWLIYPPWLSWSALSLPDALRWSGLLLLLLDGGLLIWTFVTLGRNLTDTVVTRQEHSLVTTGPYRYIQHPFYLAFAVAVGSTTLLTANWFFLLAGAVPFLFILARLPIEERKLLERFGEPYAEYRARTDAFWPRIFAPRNERH